mgnify:CR=1 FL=1
MIVARGVGLESGGVRPRRWLPYLGDSFFLHENYLLRPAQRSDRASGKCRGRDPSSSTRS